ncbi:bifunctional acetate--CoA ligase family protein/GNAT family N-acetyltransferase [Kribbella kalugense]|uniref:Acyl-CoA synthetase (NDP forming) n=1 Tax=Kribbella kalugense TaxID=2512221 RepID=A0A4R7ZXH5_9ACTN|nr:GNAT family N-acetyltransferase [Kribbella kalugense]TDW22475.1 acyl-CoA synthetase (NDP forming) [Kribbella kalugense]
MTGPADNELQYDHELPDGYPEEYEADVVLRDGATAHLRPITPADAELLVAFYARVSEQSKYYRFFAPYPELSDRDVARFTQVDYHDRLALIVTVGDEMIGVGRYERTGRHTAEVAFLIEDAHQGRGLGQLFLEHLAQAARENGIHRFVAEVLPDNRKMITVFTEAGYKVAREFEDGVIVVEFDIAPTDTSFGVMQAREQRSEALSIARLLTPSSVAVIGASRREGTIGNALLRNVRDGGFPGRLYAVNTDTKANEIEGIPAYPTIRDVADTVDLAVVAVKAEMVADVVLDCAAKGVRGLVVVSSGFAEIGDEGRKRQRYLVGLARSYGMRVIGPNALGVLNTAPGVSLNATLSPLMPSRGRVAFFCQSGALGVPILADMAARGLGLSTFVSAGNRADVSGNDLMQYWYSDEATEVVLLYLESLGNPRKFSRVSRRLAGRKPVIALKSGRSTQGVPVGQLIRRSKLPPATVESMFRQSGLIGVDTTGELFDVAQLLAHQPLPKGRRVAIVSNSDALTLLALDSMAGVGLEVAGEPQNLSADATASDFGVALSEVFADDRVHSVVVIYTPPVLSNGAEVAQVLAAAAAGSDKPVVSTFLASRSVPEELRVPDEDGGAARGSIPSFLNPQYAVGALAKATQYAEWRRRSDSRIPDLPEVDTAGAEDFVSEFLQRHPQGAYLDEADRQRLLSFYGISVLPAFPVLSADEAVDRAADLGFEVILKATAEQWRMRPDLADIWRHIHDEGDMRAAWAEMTQMFGVASDPARAQFVVQKMAPPGVPVVISTIEDVSFGPVVTFGLSGVATDLLGDRSYRMPPLTTRDAAEMVREVKAAPLLYGYRGSDPVDIPAIEDLLHRVSRLTLDLEEVVRLDLRSVLVAAQGATILDTRVRIAPNEKPRQDTPARRLT